MINRETVEKLTQQIGQLFDQRALPLDLQRKLNTLLQAGLAKMEVVTRDEFDAQTTVLEHTRAKLDQCEKQLEQFETQLNALTKQLNNDPPH